MLHRLWATTLLAGCFGDPPDDTSTSTSDTDPMGTETSGSTIATGASTSLGTETSSATGSAATTDIDTTDSTTPMPTTEDASSSDSTGANGDGLAPTAAMILPGPPGPLPSAAFVLVGAGAQQGEEAVSEAELLVDGEVVAGGSVVPMLWNPDDTASGRVSSTEAITSTGWVEFTVTSRLTHKVIGLGPPSADVVEDPYHRFYLTPNGNVFLRGFQPEGMYAPGDVFRIEVDDGIVRYLHNGNEVHQEAQLDVAASLYFDVMLNARASLSDVVISVDGGAPAAPTWADLAGLEEGVGFAAMWDASTVEDGAHDFAVRLIDEGGDEGESDPFETLVDNAPPTCAFVEPMNGDIVPTGPVDIVVTAADANLGTEALFIDGSLVLQTDGLEQVEFVWNTDVSSDGPHTLRFSVYDDAWTATDCEIVVTLG